MTHSVFAPARPRLEITTEGWADCGRPGFGETPHRFVLRRRIDRAKRLLSETDTPLVEIALNCGFASQSHFASVFRRHVDVMPSRFRKG
jgi:AraC family transcriptional regulator